MDCLSVKGTPSTNVCIYTQSFDTFCFCDLDLELMTLILDLNMKMYLHTKDKVCRSRHSKVRAQNTIWRQTDRSVQLHYCVTFMGGNKDRINKQFTY